MYMKASGAVSGRRESHVCQEEVTAVTVTSFAVSLPRRIKIPLKKKEKKAFKRAFLETNLLNIFSFYVPGLAHSQPLLSAGLRGRSWSVLCRTRQVGKESGFTGSILEAEGGPGPTISLLLADRLVPGRGFLLKGRGVS